MENHVPSDQMTRFCVKALPAQKLGTIAEHLAVCPDCHLQFRMTMARKRGYQRVAFSLEPEDWFCHDHLEYERLVEYVENNLVAEDLEIAEIHLRTCPDCREDVRVFRAYQIGRASCRERV